MLHHVGQAENGLGQVRRTLESEIASLKHCPRQANRVASEDSLSQHDRQSAPWLASSRSREIRRSKLGYMSCVMTGGNMREVAGI